jgi:hypothetical protein
MTREDEAMLAREAARMGLDERGLRLDCLKLAVQAVAPKDPERVPATAELYLNFVLGLSLASKL